MNRVIIFGAHPEAKELKAEPGVLYPPNGEVHEFESKRELNTLINTHGIKPHSKDYLAGQLFHELPDGRACLIMQGGKFLGLKTTRSVL
jgi:hypothetical protein